nr:immunoglobulin heavy chain junction region [Macaca mulatta]MOW89695.1 immunoglobulin heavy chain junction region [Macaca mulatta]MOW94518.1 immunoglobulin heavy chain junction region [Macaca mulatta]MOW95204.1 immunoglobulin heavy chain junction region [Macaca mulatta]MOW96510.1 immunoglobulin heavy chain junction region [Macaca mulatta]
CVTSRGQGGIFGMTTGGLDSW